MNPTDKRVSWKDDVVEIKTDKRILKQLGKVIEMRILDLEGNLIMIFWKGEKYL